MNARRRNLDPAHTREEILAAAGRVAIKDGLHVLTIAATAREADRAASLISAHFSIAELRETLMREAIAREHAELLSTGLAIRDPIAMTAPEALLAKARKILATR